MISASFVVPRDIGLEIAEGSCIWYPMRQMNHSQSTLMTGSISLTFGLDLVAVGLVLRLEVEVLVCWSQEHLTVTVLAADSLERL